MIRIRRKIASSIILKTGIDTFVFNIGIKLKRLDHNQCSTLRFNMSSIDYGNLVCKKLKLMMFWTSF